MIRCGNARKRTLCDICDGPVPARMPKFPWRGGECDMCWSCRGRWMVDKEWKEWAQKVLIRKLKTGAAS